MKYDARACSFNMDTGCVELLLLDGRKISIDCTGLLCQAGGLPLYRQESSFIIVVSSKT